MKFDSSLFLKWLEPTSEGAQSLQFKIAGQCAFYCLNQRGECLGLTVFEPRDLNQAFAAKMKKRIGDLRAPGLSFLLQVPEFIAHRLESELFRKEELGIEIVISPFLAVTHSGNFFKLRSKLTIVNVDDSPVILKLLKHIISGFPHAELLMQLTDSTVAASQILSISPDVVTMDIQMPNKTGVEVLKEILQARYVPVMMVSSLSLEEGSLVLEALHCNTFDYLQKPKMEGKSEFVEALGDRLVQAAASYQSPAYRGYSAKPAKGSASPTTAFPKDMLWCLGASTGGTQALTEVFTSLPTEIPPTLVVQHIPPLFSKSFADLTNSLCPFEVKEAVDGEVLKANTIYIAPGGQQMAITTNGSGGLKIVISDDSPINRFKPSVDFLFQSIARVKNYRVVAGILTGMGKDGAVGLLELREKGALTFSQDEATCTVFGMPRAAEEIGASQKVVPLGEIAQTLLSGVNFFSKAS